MVRRVHCALQDRRASARIQPDRGRHRSRSADLDRSPILIDALIDPPMEMTCCAQARRADRRAACPVRDRCARYRVRDPARRRRRSGCAAAGSRRRRCHPDPVGHHHGRRGAGGRAAAQGGRQGRDRAGQRRRAGGHRPRRPGGQRPAVQHHHGRRTRPGTAARGGQEHPGRRCLGQVGGVEAQSVHRCRAGGQDGRGGRARPDRPALRGQGRRVRHHRHRLRPLPAASQGGGPRHPARRPADPAGRRGRHLHPSAEDAGDPRPDRRGRTRRR